MISLPLSALRRTRRAGMLGALRRRDDPRDLWQPVGQDVLRQKIEVAGGETAVAQRRVRAGAASDRVAEAAESGQRVVGEVVGHVLVDQPADAGGLEALGVGDQV